MAIMDKTATKAMTSHMYMFENVPTTGIGVGVGVALGIVVGAGVGVNLGSGVDEGVEADSGMKEESLLCLTGPPISSEGLGVGVVVTVGLGVGVGAVPGISMSERCPAVPVTCIDPEYVVL